MTNATFYSKRFDVVSKKNLHMIILFTNQSFIFATQLLLELSILYSILNYFVHNATQ